MWVVNVRLCSLLNWNVGNELLQCDIIKYEKHVRLPCLKILNLFVFFHQFSILLLHVANQASGLRTIEVKPE